MVFLTSDGFTLGLLGGYDAEWPPDEWLLMMDSVSEDSVKKFKKLRLKEGMKRSTIEIRVTSLYTTFC